MRTMHIPASLLFCLFDALSQLSAQSKAPENTVPVNYAQPGLAAPELIPITLQFPHIPQCDAVTNVVSLSVMVDEMGQARDVTFLKPLGTLLDLMALKIAQYDRFKPGTLEGKAVPVAIALEVKIKACFLQNKGPDGKPKTSFAPAEPPRQAVSVLPLPPANEQRRLLVGADAAAPLQTPHDGLSVRPIVLAGFDPLPTEYAREMKISPEWKFSFMVDANGLPRDIKLEKGVNPRIDPDAEAAMLTYRFKPAMHNGYPVQAKFSLVIRQIYQSKPPSAPSSPPNASAK